MLAAGYVGDAQVTFPWWHPIFGPNVDLQIGNWQWGDSHGTAHFEVPRTPIQLSFPGKGVILYEVNSQYKWLI